MPICARAGHGARTGAAGQLGAQTVHQLTHRRITRQRTGGGGGRITGGGDFGLGINGSHQRVVGGDEGLHRGFQRVGVARHGDVVGLLVSTVSNRSKVTPLIADVILLLADDITTSSMEYLALVGALPLS
jgi:hypothetical protein